MKRHRDLHKGLHKELHMGYTKLYTYYFLMPNSAVHNGVHRGIYRGIERPLDRLRKGIQSRPYLLVVELRAVFSIRPPDVINQRTTGGQNLSRACGHMRSSFINESGYRWFQVIGSVVLMTVQMNDMFDQLGDQACVPKEDCSTGIGRSACTMDYCSFGVLLVLSLSSILAFERCSIVWAGVCHWD